MSEFAQEREAFAKLQLFCKSNIDIVNEYLRLIAGISSLYNTAIHENRFVTGGAIEAFTSILLHLAGVSCGIDARKGGLILEYNNKRIEVNTLTTGINNVILHNKVEATDQIRWQHARLFIISGIGIIYGDRESVNQDYIYDKPGHIELHRQALMELQQNSNNVIKLDIPYKPPLSDNNNYISRASLAVASNYLTHEPTNWFKADLLRPIWPHFHTF